jgi:hypothetical protein
MLKQGTNLFNKLIRELQAIRVNTSRINILSQGMVDLANLQEYSQHITPYQTNFVNEKRINLRNNIINL